MPPSQDSQAPPTEPIICSLCPCNTHFGICSCLALCCVVMVRFTVLHPSSQVCQAPPTGHASLSPPPRHRLAPPSLDSNGELSWNNYWLFQCPNSIHSPPPLLPCSPPQDSQAPPTDPMCSLCPCNTHFGSCACLALCCVYIGGNSVFHCIAPFFLGLPGSTHWPRLLIPPPGTDLLPPLQTATVS